jgi:hypothetical protein
VTSRRQNLAKVKWLAKASYQKTPVGAFFDQACFSPVEIRSSIWFHPGSCKSAFRVHIQAAVHFHSSCQTKLAGVNNITVRD